jgi:hypothetical protein
VLRPERERERERQREIENRDDPETESLRVSRFVRAALDASETERRPSDSYGWRREGVLEEKFRGIQEVKERERERERGRGNRTEDPRHSFIAGGPANDFGETTKTGM